MIPEWLKGKTIAVWDIEADWIPSTKIFCVSVEIVRDEVIIEPAKIFTIHWVPYSHGSIMQAVTLINTCDYNAGHNIMGYDVPMMQKLAGTDIVSTPLDTLILAKIVFSKDDLFAMDGDLGVDKKLFGSYSAKAFGQRMGDFKIDYEDFSHLNREMAIYCNQDVSLTSRLLLFLLAKSNFPIEAVVDIEHKAASIIAEQTALGFHLDIVKARALNTALLTEKTELARQLSLIFKPKWLKDGQEKTYKKPSKVRKYLPNNNYIPVW